MKKLKYKGSMTGVILRGGFSFKKGETRSVPDKLADGVLKDHPELFEEVRESKEYVPKKKKEDKTGGEA